MTKAADRELHNECGCDEWGFSSFIDIFPCSCNMLESLTLNENSASE